MTARRSGAALWCLCGGLVLAAASSARPAPAPAVQPSDGGRVADARDAGPALSASTRDGGAHAAALSAEDLEVVSNLELLEHLPESDVLDLLVPLRDE